jgi:hypothetical protein
MWLTFASLGLWLGMAAPVGAQQAPCQFVLGFKTLHDLVSANTGECVDNQAFAPNGDAQQHTAKGLMAWRKADNWTAFTDGYRTWINGPNGIQSRLNTARFPWEGDATAPPARAPGAALQPLTFSGFGAQTTAFTVPATGIAVAKMDYVGNGNFLVRAVNPLGGTTSLGNQIGTWSGTTATNLAAGGYQLVVGAYGPWTVTIWTAPHWPNGSSVAAPLTGSGTNIVPVRLSAGTASFSMHYLGDGNFVVRLLRDDGSLVGYLANQVSNAWAGTSVQQIPATGNYVVAVDSAGPWTIMVQPS